VIWTAAALGILTLAIWFRLQLPRPGNLASPVFWQSFEVFYPVFLVFMFFMFVSVVKWVKILKSRQKGKGTKAKD
jgi:hypothetical protein